VFVVLLGIGFLAGVVTAVSPCVLPVLPILLAGGASGGRKRALAIIAGLVTSFVLVTLFAAWVLDQLGLPKDILRNVAIALLFVIAAMLVFPPLARIVAKPFELIARAPARTGDDVAGGIVLGASLGLVFVPCGGPVLGAITTAAASLDFGWRTLLLTVAYALGAGVPMLVIALLGQRASERTRWLRLNAPRVRASLGVVVALATLAIVFKLDQKAQTALSDYTGTLQKYVEKSDFAQRELAKLRWSDVAVAHAGTSLADYGPAPELAGIAGWVNSPPLTLRSLRGKVVLIDFWTYSCINCLRTLPHVKAWDRTYRREGLVVVGVHTPEFAFESVPSNVEDAVRDLGVRYPVALDNGYGTWNVFGNRYWPAKYLIDKRGHVRYAHFGEGSYEETERRIRTLLGEPAARPASPSIADETPDGVLTPETYLGWERLSIAYRGDAIRADRFASYRFGRTLLESEYAYAGRWSVERERIVAGRDARLRIRLHAQDVHLVLAGRGRVDVLVDGERQRSVRVGQDRLYTVAKLPRRGDALLELRFTRGLAAYAFTFG
jgi:cytochrome c biogenesis protein CcdA/thiol-disulfide isomerase/thioredoxin